MLALTIYDLGSPALDSPKSAAGSQLHVPLSHSERIPRLQRLRGPAACVKTLFLDLLSCSQCTLNFLCIVYNWCKQLALRSNSLRSDERKIFFILLNSLNTNRSDKEYGRMLASRQEEPYMIITELNMLGNDIT